MEEGRKGKNRTRENGRYWKEKEEKTGGNRNFYRIDRRQGKLREREGG